MWSEWWVFCDYGFSVSALWCPLTTPTILLRFLLPWTWSSSSGPSCARAANAPWTWSCSSRPPLIIGNQNAKVGSQETPRVTGKLDLGVQNEAGQRLIEFCQENTLVTENTLLKQHKRRLYIWTSPDSQLLKSDWLDSLQPKMEKHYTVSKNKTRSWLWLRSWSPHCQIQT